MGDPVIYNIQSSYRLGDELRINCTSFDSRPGAALSWHLNGDPVRHPRTSCPSAIEF